MYKNNMRKVILMLFIIGLILGNILVVNAAPQVPINFSLNVGQSDNPQEVASSLQILFVLSIIPLIPTILIMMTSFTRIIIVLSFLRHALGTQQMPPNQVLIGIALFLTLFIMSPIGTQINNDALQPYLRNEIEQDKAIDLAVKPLREFMLRNTREKDLALFASLSSEEQVEDAELLPTRVIIPAFIISELKTAFQFGFIIYIPFLIIDMVVASTLMSMGMMMLPPVMISLPFKILLFILIDGWNLTIQSLLTSFK